MTGIGVVVLSIGIIEHHLNWLDLLFRIPLRGKFQMSSLIIVHLTNLMIHQLTEQQVGKIGHVRHGAEVFSQIDQLAW